MTDTLLSDTFSQFTVPGKVTEIVPFGTGHINDTYACRCRTGDGETRWVLQRLNHEVFRRPFDVMENISRVTAHVREAVVERGGDPAREVLEFVPAADGSLLFERDDHTFWRVCRLVEGACTYDEPPGTAQVRAAARAFGEFQSQLSSLGKPRLHETIPGFHHTPSRFEALRRAVDRDEHGRVGAAQESIAFALARVDTASVLTDLYDAGLVPERVTHNDTKLNNVMFDNATGEALCVIDLDTVMPGLALYDFGDMVRVAANRGAEDDPDTARVGVDLGLFAELSQGYLEALRGVLNEAEIEHLAIAPRLISLEQGVRFLTDYLEGDHYYKVHSADHNLQRCRAQFALVADMERQDKEMRRVIGECL